jgi:DNA-binding transcriptional ArsR family regulator
LVDCTAGNVAWILVRVIWCHLLRENLWLAFFNQTNTEEESDGTFQPAATLLAATRVDCSESMTPTKEKTEGLLERTASHQAPLHKLLGNPLRTRIIMALGGREASPKELAEILDEDFQRVCNQVRYLKRNGFIELVDEDRRKGGVQHFYKAVVRPRLEADEWELVPDFARRSNSGLILRQIVADFRAALLSGDFDAHRHRALLQKPMMVDEQGMRELDESALRHLDEQERIEAESATRRVESGERGISVKAVTIVHPAAGSGLEVD